MADPGNSDAMLQYVLVIKSEYSDCQLSAQNTIDRVIEFAGNVPRLFGRGLIAAYRYTLSPLIGYECRHLPTCSHYGDEAIERFGLWAGGWMTAGRLCRCHPLGTRGLDFVPHKIPPRARWYVPWRYARWRGTNSEPPTN